MAANIEQSVIEKLRGLPPAKQQEALEFIEQLADHSPAAQVDRPIWEVIEQISASIPSDEWDKLPVDGAEQHDHYLYGSPKK